MTRSYCGVPGMLVAGILLSNPAVADKPPWAGAGKGKGRDAQVQPMQSGGYFVDRHRVNVREYYGNEFRRGHCPPGLAKMAQQFFDYQKFDIDVRMVDEGRTDPSKLVTTHEISKPGVVLTNTDVRVSMCVVRHPPIKDAYAYRFDAKDRSVVISGDTAYAPELAEFAKGADVLVHEVMYLPGIEALLKRLPNAKRLREHLMAAHTLPEDVGKIAAQAGVKTLVLTHFVPGDDASITDEQWAADARKHFKGEIVVGRDLLEI